RQSFTDDCVKNPCNTTSILLRCGFLPNPWQNLAENPHTSPIGMDSDRRALNSLIFQKMIK
ncbi:MAG: hypothetical protein NC120_10660, partial [Ruminococcus sp.]|nr:hypothetical protein [Ruminococcus sp.]